MSIPTHVELLWVLFEFNLAFIFPEVLGANSLANQLFLQADDEKLKSLPVVTPLFPSFRKLSISRPLADSLGTYPHIASNISYVTTYHSFCFRCNLVTLQIQNVHLVVFLPPPPPLHPLGNVLCLP